MTNTTPSDAGSKGSAANIDIERLRAELARKDAQVRRLVLALTNIADTDYRGNRSMESVQAHRTLVEEGIRAE
jgi:hypothetical protein